jgi:hypothetical protein
MARCVPASKSAAGELSSSVMVSRACRHHHASSSAINGTVPIRMSRMCASRSAEDLQRRLDAPCPDAGAPLSAR